MKKATRTQKGKTTKPKATIVQPQKIKPITEKQTKSQILKAIAEDSELTIKQVKEVLTTLSQIAKSHLVKKGSGEFVIPEMGVKIVRKTRPATKKRQGRNPLTGETITIPAKPKRETIRIRPLKSLKEIIA